MSEPVPGAESAKKRTFRIRSVLILVLLLLFVLAIASHHASDLAVIEGGTVGPVRNLIGPLGAKTARLLFYLFGVSVYPLVTFLILCVVRRFLPGKRNAYPGWGWAVLSASAGMVLMFALWPQSFVSVTEYLGIGSREAPLLALSGGTIGQFFVSPETNFLPAGVIRRHIGLVGCAVASGVFLISGLVYVFICDWLPLILSDVDFHVSLKKKREEAPPEAVEPVPEMPPPEPEKKVPYRPEPEAAESGPEMPPPPQAEISVKSPDPLPPPVVASMPDPLPEPAPAEEKKSSRTPAAPLAIANGKNGSSERSALTEQLKDHQAAPETPVITDYKLPPVTLFDEPKAVEAEDNSHLEHSKDALQATLDSFNIDGHVSGVVVGPRVTRFKIELDPGVKVSLVEGIKSNIAMELRAESVRVLAPIPGENAVGVEVPNKTSSIVYIRSLLESEEWKELKGSAGQIPIILGRDVPGRTVIANLAKAPHLLIAGSTGSGKSVCMNTLIMSLLQKFSPYDLKLILVDPKRVELAMYKPLPHLITPVVNDPKLVPLALRWADAEMEKRYRIMESVNAKNLKSFNSRPKPETPELDLDGNPVPERIPLLVIIVDELADIMMSEAKKDVETYICRIAQKGRAAGIHLVIATQTPRKDVITGLIKANLPTKIAFRVTSGIDSRVILDAQGAEQLLGMGDMLFLAPGGEGLERVQGTMVDDSEIQKVVNFVCPQVPQHFNSDVVAEAEIINAGPDEKKTSSSSGNGNDPEMIDPNEQEHEESLRAFPAGRIRSVAEKYLKPGDNDLMRRALEIVLEEQRVSTSYLQRRLGIGYNKSAEVIDELERRGVVSAPLPGGQKRDILILDQLQETNEI